MADEYEIPTIAETHETMVADQQNRIPDDDLTETSDNWKRLGVVAGAVGGLDARLYGVFNELMPDRCSDPMLDRHGGIRGVSRRGATAARKSEALRVTGTSGTPLTIGDELVHASGLRFQVNENASIPLGGTIDVDVVAIDTGAATRLPAGETLEFSPVIAGLDTVATLVLDLDEGGDDAEPADEYRTRILDRIRQPGMGGNANDYRAWALEVDGVVTAYIYPNRNGLGTVDVAALHGGSGTARLLNVDEILALQEHLDEKRPVAITVRVLTTSAEELDVEVVVQAVDDSAYRFHWGDQVPLTVSSFNASTRVLEFSGNRPADMKAGHQIVVKGVGDDRNDGHPYTIESLPATATQVILRADNEFATRPPLAGWLVYSGGPLVTPSREAILALFDSLGPGRGDHASGSFDSAVRPGAIEKVVRSISGVFDITTVAPAASADAANVAPSSTIGLKVARQVLVRRKW